MAACIFLELKYLQPEKKLRGQMPRSLFCGAGVLLKASGTLLLRMLRRYIKLKINIYIYVAALRIHAYMLIQIWTRRYAYAGIRGYRYVVT